MSNEDRYALTIQVATAYIEAQSDPNQDRYVFAYTIHMQNTGTVAAQLLSRHWIITDANSKEQHVRGAGVVGETPYLQPGQSYEYTSGTLLPTPVGTMHGSYRMLADDGEYFDAPIPVFTLSIPRVLH